MAADLVRRAVVDAQRVGPAANIDTERFPGEWLLKDPLTEIAGQEQPIGARGSDGGQKAQFGDADILRLVDDGEIEGSLGGMLGERAEHVRPGDDVAPPKLGPHALEDRPQDLALLAADPRLATKTRHVAISLPAVQLPGIDDIAPLAVEKAFCEAMPIHPGFRRGRLA